MFKLTFTFLKPKEKRTTEFSRFIREASSGEKKKVFIKVIRKATEDQKKIMAR